MNAPAWVPWVLGLAALMDGGVLWLAWRAGNRAADAQEGEPS